MIRYNIYTDRQTEPAAAYCDKCKQDVYHGEARYRWEGRWICPDCFKLAVENLLNEYPEQVAAEMGIDMERYI